MLGRHFPTIKPIQELDVNDQNKKKLSSKKSNIQLINSNI